LIPERGAPNQDAVNVGPNIIAENGRESNQSDKRTWENGVVRYAQDNPRSDFRSVHEPKYRGNDPRPYKVSHGLEENGKRVKKFDVDIDNPK
jgi:hypothetical protein